MESRRPRQKRYPTVEFADLQEETSSDDPMMTDEATGRGPEDESDGPSLRELRDWLADS